VIFLVKSACIVVWYRCFDWGHVQNGLATKVEKSRKQIKERKNRAKKIRGVKKVRDSRSGNA
jgi:hypothetical protein